MTGAEIVCIEAHKFMEDRRAMTYGYIEPNVPPHGYGQRGRYEIPYKAKDREGKPRCRWCLGPVEPPRRTWCSDGCVQARLRREWAHLCGEIRARDKVCRMCGGVSYQRTGHWGFVEDGPYCPLREYFEVDHIIAVKEGGTDDPENLRLLCRPCHKRVTAKQRAKWAAASKPQRQEQLAI